MGKYSGSFKWWKGKQDGETFVYTDEILVTNILQRNIKFNKGMRLDTITITSLKAAYVQQQALTI